MVHPAWSPTDYCDLRYHVFAPVIELLTKSSPKLILAATFYYPVEVFLLSLSCVLQKNLSTINLTSFVIAC